MVLLPFLRLVLLFSIVLFVCGCGCCRLNENSSTCHDAYEHCQRDDLSARFPHCRDAGQGGSKSGRRGGALVCRDASTRLLTVVRKFLEGLDDGFRLAGCRRLGNECPELSVSAFGLLEHCCMHRSGYRRLAAWYLWSGFGGAVGAPGAERGPRDGAWA